MPRGITEDDVWKACDALLLEGARPTIERVRLKLGRGSPNTVSPMLETWFKHLGTRIKDPGAFSAPAAVAEPVFQAAQHFWEVAQAEARRELDDRVREGLATAVANVEAEKERATVAEAAAFSANAKAAHLLAEQDRLRETLEAERTAHAATAATLDAARQQLEERTSRLRAIEADIAKRESDIMEVVRMAQAHVSERHRLVQAYPGKERESHGKGLAQVFGELPTVSQLMRWALLTASWRAALRVLPSKTMPRGWQRSSSTAPRPAQGRQAAPLSRWGLRVA